MRGRQSKGSGRCGFRCIGVAGACILLSSSATWADEATFSIDLAAMVAHRYFGDIEVNRVTFVEWSTGDTLVSISEDLFGTTEWDPNIPPDGKVNQGSLETGIISSAPITSPEFFMALEAGDLGLSATFTDTDDALFAIDFLSVQGEAGGTPFEWVYGWPVGNENNGFGIGLADGQNLPDEFPGVLEPTGTGFDEEISSKSILVRIPEPTAALLWTAGVLVLLHRRRSASAHVHSHLSVGCPQAPAKTY